jgi:hypothetical protein
MLYWYRGHVAYLDSFVVDNRNLSYWYRGYSAMANQKKLGHIGGIVTLNGAAVAGATMVCIPEHMKGVSGTTTTSSSGTYDFDVTPDYNYLVVAEYASGLPPSGVPPSGVWPAGVYPFRALAHWHITPEES